MKVFDGNSKRIRISKGLNPTKKLTLWVRAIYWNDTREYSENSSDLENLNIL